MNFKHFFFWSSPYDIVCIYCMEIPIQVIHMHLSADCSHKSVKIS